VTRHERVLSSRPGAPWLPPGGRADVVLAQDDEAPGPTCLVRLLVVQDGSVLCVPRDGHGKEDLPTRVVPPGDAARSTVEQLARDVLGETVPLHLLGFVRNTVTAPTPDYPWPSPVAHFAVWRAEPSGRRVAGTWRALEDPGDLVDRHWWPLVRHVV
jgi:hypothetical protein